MGSDRCGKVVAQFRLDGMKLGAELGSILLKTSGSVTGSANWLLDCKTQI